MDDTRLDFALLVASLIIILFLAMAKVHCQPERAGYMPQLLEDGDVEESP